MKLLTASTIFQNRVARDSIHDPHKVAIFFFTAKRAARGKTVLPCVVAPDGTLDDNESSY